MAENKKFTRLINSDGTKQAVALDKISFDEQTKKLTLYSSVDNSIKEETTIPASEVDTTLSKSGSAADAKVTGNAIKAGEEAITELERNVDNKIADLKSMVGTPLKASTASAMNNSEKIYVYTGSESGYTNGHWYYYDGSKWVDGGVYNSTAVETDKTLSVENMPADAKKTGEEITSIKEGLNHDEEFVGIHRSSPGIPNQRVPFYIPKNTVVTIYTIDGEPFADSSKGQIQFFYSDQSEMTTYASLRPTHGNARTVVYDGDVDAEYFSVIPITQASNVAVVWYENDGIKEEKENLLTSLSDVGIEAINLFNTRRFWTNNTAVKNNNDGTYTVGTSDYGRTTFGDELYLEKGQYLLFASPSVGYSYLSPANNINTIIVANYSTSSQIVTLKESVTVKLCFRVTSAPSEAFTIRPFLYQKTNAVNLAKYSALYSLKGTPILFPPSEPYKYTGEPITEQLLTGTGNLLTPLYSLYDALESEYSNYMTKEVIGHDQSGSHEMRCYTITQYKGADKPVILWISGVHASERFTHTSTYMLVKELLENHDSDNVLGFIWRNCTLKVIPIANPWGLANGGSRYNSRGVNLNRNFPCDWVYSEDEYSNSGASPASEAETQNIMNFVKANQNALFAVNRHDSGTLTSENGRMAYVVDTFKIDVNVLRSFFATMQNVIPSSYSWIVEGRPQSAYDFIFSILSNDATPGMMDKWFNMYGTHGCLLEIARPDSSGYTADKQQDFLKINLEIVINMLASVLMQNQLIVSADDLWAKYPMPERT